MLINNRINPKILEAVDANNANIDKVESLIFLLRQMWSAYFVTSPPTAAALDKIERGYDDIHKWLRLIEYNGEKIIEDMEDVSVNLGCGGDVQ